MNKFNLMYPHLTAKMKDVSAFGWVMWDYNLYDLWHSWPPITNGVLGIFGLSVYTDFLYSLPMNRDIKVLRKWRTQEPVLQRKWKGSKGRFGLFEDPKSWKGAKFTDGLGLTFLDVEGNSVLYGNTLTSLPAEIGQLTTLRFLHLNYNQLTTLPTQIGQLTSLETLHLSGNNKTMSLPGSISKLYSLRMLSLGGYQFKHFPEVIKALRTYGCEFDINEAGCCGNCVIS